MNSREMSFKDERVRAIVQAAFPGAKSRRTVKLFARSSHHISDCWDGGSRNYCRFVRLSDLSALSSESVPNSQRQYAANPYNLPIYDVTLQPGFVIVEHCIFCGKDLGYRIYHHPILQLNEGSNQLLLSEKIGANND